MRYKSLDGSVVEIGQIFHIFPIVVMSFIAQVFYLTVDRDKTHGTILYVIKVINKVVIHRSIFPCLFRGPECYRNHEVFLFVGRRRKSWGVFVFIIIFINSNWDFVVMKGKINYFEKCVFFLLSMQCIRKGWTLERICLE
jgi:hypothetical protein